MNRQTLPPSSTLLFLACLLAGVSSLSARQIWVATNGNDNTGNGNPDKPYQTIQQAVNVMNGGDEVIVRNGTYNVGTSAGGQVYINNKGGTASQRTVIRAENRWGAQIRSASPFGGIEVQNSDYLTIQGFDVAPQNANAATNQGAGIEFWYSNHAIIRDNYSHDWGCNGISFRYGDYVTIEENVARDNAKKSNFNCSGISVYQPRELNQNGGFHIYIRRNVAFENECRLPFNVGAGRAEEPTDGNGIILDDFYNTQDSDGMNRDGNGQFRAYKQGTLVENNLVFNNGGTGFKAFRVDQATVRHNTFYNNLYVLMTNIGYYDKFGLYNPPYHPGEVSFEDCPGIFDLSNNIIVSRNDTRAKALNYVVYGADDFSVGFGWLGRHANILVGNLNVPDIPMKTEGYGELRRERWEQSYPRFVNPTFGIGGFSSVKDFRQYYQLANNSPGNNSGDNGRSSGVDLQGEGRPKNGVVERGCYEGTATFTVGGGGENIRGTNYAYRDNLEDGWSSTQTRGGVLTVSDPGIRQSGTAAIKFFAEWGWGTIELRRGDALPGGGLQRIAFNHRRWDTDPAYDAWFRTYEYYASWSGRTWVNFRPQTGWQEASFTLAELGNPPQVRRMDFNVPSGKTVWIDNLRFIYSTSNLNTVELEQDLVEGAADRAPLTVMPTVNHGAFDVELEVPERLEEVDMFLVAADGRQVDAATLPVLPGRNRMHFDVTASDPAEGVYLLVFRGADGSFQRSERVVIHR